MEREAKIGRNLNEQRTLQSREELIKTARLDYLLKHTTSDAVLSSHWQSFGLTIYFSEEDGLNIRHDQKTGVFMLGNSFDWQPATYGEVVEVLRRGEKDVEWLGENYFSTFWPKQFPETVPWSELATTLITAPVSGKEKILLEEVLRENNLEVAEACLNLAEEEAELGIDRFTGLISKARSLSYNVGRSLDEIRIQSIYRKHEEAVVIQKGEEQARLLEYARETMAEVELTFEREGILAVLWKVDALLSRVGDKTKLDSVRDFAIKATPVLLSEIEKEIDGWKIGWLPIVLAPIEVDVLEHQVKWLVFEARKYSSIAGIDIEEKLVYLTRKFSRLKRQSRLPKPLRSIVC